MNAAKILIAVEQAVASRGLRESLANLGYELAGSVASGEQAVEAVRRQEPALVLMDVGLAGEMNSLVAATRIREYSDVPVVFLAADSAAPTLERVRQAAAYGCLVEPLREPDLQLAIELALHRHRAEREFRQQNQALERQVRERTAELEAAHRELNALSYSVSHDLRAPLRAVDGFAAILASDYQDRLDAEGRRLLGVIQGQARHLGRLVEAILRFSRLGRQELRQQEIDQNQLVGEVIEELRRADQDREIQFHVAPLPPAWADAALLRQVWQQLLSNALKFTRPRTTAMIWLGSDPAEQGTGYFVRDNGIGFDMQFAHRLFGLFQRLHEGDQFEGLGAGLSLVQRIIHRHGGRVWARSEPDRGATFHFSLPGPGVSFDGQPQASAYAPPPTPAAGR